MKLLQNNPRISIAVTVTLITLALGGCSKHEAENSANDINIPKVSGDTVTFDLQSAVVKKIQTVPLVQGDKSMLKLPGHLVWDEDHTVRLSPPVQGRLQTINVQVGDPISAGQVLAYLSAPDVGVAQADAARARIDLMQAERNFNRNKELADAGIIAGKELEETSAALSRSREEAQRTAVRIKALGGGSAIDQRYAVRSPIKGVLVERNTNPGLDWNPDQADKPLFTVADPEYLWVWIDAPEANLNDFHHGQFLNIVDSHYPDQTFVAVIDYVADALDPASRTLKVRAKIHNADRLLKSEMYVQATLPTQNQTLLDIPAKAVFLKGNAQMVFVKTAAGVFQRKAIQAVRETGDWVSISTGLNPGDEVVLDGGIYLEKVLEESNQSDSAPKATSHQP